MMHMAGLIGLHLEVSRALFQQLIPFNLILSALILAWFHREWNMGFLLFCFGTFWLGYGMEVAGVHTGKIFGVYRYGESMGIKLAGVPPMIGLQWLVVVYCAGLVSRQWLGPWWAWVSLGALITTLLDALIEPMAITQNMWTWQGGMPPFQNYVAWFVISWVMLAIMALLKEQFANPLARRYLLIQLVFFAGFRVIAWAV
jgi:putative membrane protein